DRQLVARQFFVATPPRLAVDIEGIDLSPSLRELVAKVQPDDPNIAGIRVGQNAPGVVRLAVDLKQAALPQVFSLPPVAAYQHRLVFDLYPAQAPDPREALIAGRLRHASAPPRPTLVAAAPSAGADPLEERIARHSNASAAEPGSGLALPLPAAPQAPPALPPAPPPRPASPARATDRLIIIALDPGHGGEDPGAIGPGGT